MSNSQANAANQLKQTVDAAVREANKDQTNALLQSIHEMTVELIQIRAQLTSIAENQKSGTKSVNRTPKATEVAKEGTDGTSNVTNATFAAALVSKPAFFKHMYKTSEDFRKEYSNQFTVDAIKDDATIAKKKTDSDKLTAEANAVWNAIRIAATKDTNPDIKALFAKYNAFFDDTKKNHLAAQKAAPLTTDDAPEAPTAQ